VLDPVCLICCSSEAYLSVRLIFRVVSLEPDHLAVTIKCKHVGGDTVEEPDEAIGTRDNLPDNKKIKCRTFARCSINWIKSSRNNCSLDVLRY